ncbi:MAG: 50S ribosomal protein L29 [Candidatus Levyibacteriota bacterium]
MKTTDKQTLQTKSTIELQKLIEETYNTLGQLKLDNVQNKLKNTRSIFHTRKEIAIMQSILHMKLTTKEDEK